MDDQKIIQLYWDRNEQAIPATAQKYGSYCTAIAGNILGSPEDTEECVNDTYLHVWNAIPPHRPRLLSAFLGTITRNLALKRHRQNTAEKRGGGQAALVLDELLGLVSDGNDVEQTLDRKELISAIDAFLARLSPLKRSIFVCRYWYFDSISQIAQRFGMTENHVSVTLTRLRRKLRQHLLERGFVL